MRTLKRAGDLAGASVGLLVLWPAFLVIALATRLGDGGPVFFRQLRVGRDGRPFRIWKFRTMTVGAEQRGAQLTVDGDARVTRAGAVLRRLRLDELPQLLNVLTGEMSLVGPRPEVPRYVALYGAAQRRVLALRPGITSPATLAYRDEATLLAASPDPERTYVQEVMPDKIRINLAYAERATAWSDLLTILRTVVPIARDAPTAQRARERSARA